jgi:hypothetical protein
VPDETIFMSGETGLKRYERADAQGACALILFTTRQTKKKISVGQQTGHEKSDRNQIMPRMIAPTNASAA